MTIAANPPPIAWYGTSFAYYEEPPTDDELDARAAQARADRLAGFSPEQFGPRPERGGHHGVVFGRFLPVHDGHRYLIELARADSARVTVFVRVRHDDPIPWPTRRDWLTELFPDVPVIAIDDPPGPPHEAKLLPHWAEQIRSHITPEVVYAGSDQEQKLAQHLRVRRVRVDRTAVPTSGTRIRTAPLRWFHHLPPPVRAYYARTVCLIGPESSGKSTVARRLAEHYRTVQVPEAGRLWGSLDSPLFWRAADVSGIAERQLTQQRLLARQANRILVCDTDVLCVRLWSERLFDAAPEWLYRASAEHHADLYLLTGPDLPFSGSADRNQPAERAEFHRRCLRELVLLGHRYATLDGAVEQRFAQAVTAIDALLAEG